jgi:AbrB family looped-hinge helix DNA binding protein
MAKVTSKLQVTIPKRIAEQYGIAPGDDVAFIPAGDGIRLVPARSQVRQSLSTGERLRLFDASTARQSEREKRMKLPAKAQTTRDWKREDLYTRGKPG